MRAGLVLALVAGLVVLPSRGDAQSASDQLAEARARIAAVGAEIEAAEGVVATSGSELDVAEARLAEVEAVVNEIATTLEQQVGRVQAAQAQLDLLQAANDRVQATFDRRITAIYKGSAPNELDVVLSSRDVRAVMNRASFLEVVNTGDSASLEDLRASRQQVRTQQERLAGEQQLLEDLKAEQEVVLAEVEALRDTRYLALVDARARVDELQRQQEDHEGEAQRLEEIIREAQAAAAAQAAAQEAAAAASEAAGSTPAPVISAPSSGGYVWPLCGSVTSEYGRRWGRQHKGIDIDDNRTKAIVAAKSGTVIYAAYDGGYGNLMLIQHGDGVVTAYAHQSSFAVGSGTQVATGQRIGTVGSTGQSTGPHLHFETRVGGAAVNPRRYLTGNGC